MSKHYIVPVTVTSTVEYNIIADSEEEAMSIAEDLANEDDLSHGGNLNYKVNRPIDTYNT